jgi:F420H(2)-dependent quinone reductase
MADAFVKILEVHQAIYERSGGLFGHRLFFGMPSLLLRTVGRKTGEERTSALIYGKDGDEYLVVASKGGHPRPPGWWHNLNAKPECEIQIGRKKLKVVARSVFPGDPGYDRMWKTMNNINHGTYEKYQEKTKRQIAVVALRPTS